MAEMASTADTAAIMANMPNTANILAQDRREADTSSAEAGRNSAAANRENTVTGVAVIGAAIGGIIDSPSINSSRSVDSALPTPSGIGTPNGGGARFNYGYSCGYYPSYRSDYDYYRVLRIENAILGPLTRGSIHVELAHVLMRLDHIASLIVDSNHGSGTVSKTEVIRKQSNRYQNNRDGRARTSRE
jgi:hypothetical protein